MTIASVKASYYLKGLLLAAVIVLLFLMFFASENVGFWLIVAFLVAGGVSITYSLVAQVKNALIKPTHRLYAKDFSLKFVATIMGLFLVVGTLLYLYVFYTMGHDERLAGELRHSVEFSNAEYLFRSLICSLDLFMLDVDSNILDRLDGHSALKGWLAVQAVLSFACTVAMLVGLVYSRLHAYYRLNYATKIHDNNNHLYLFFGDNEPTELLIKDIIKNDPKAVAVIIDQANLKEDDNNEWEGIVSLIAHKQKVFKTAEKTGAHVAIASMQLADIDGEISRMDDFDAFGYLGVPKIKKLLHSLVQTADPQLHIFFMGDDEDLNIRNISVLANDATITSLVKDRSFYHRIYCHARFNGPNRVAQDIALRKNLSVKIVDSSHIAVELLKLDSSCHPVNVAHLSAENLATVDAPLKTLIIGFGEVGRDAFRFLYEFGAFVYSKDHNFRNPFDCTIVDTNLDNIEGALKASMPGIFSEKYNHDNVTVNFKNTDYNSELFNTGVLTDDYLRGVNYIVISIGDNDEAIALAARLFNRVRKVRKDISDLRIFVRCTDDRKAEGARTIADHYNFGYGDGASNVPVIRIFGLPKNTYTYDLVVSDRLIEEGKLFHEKYRLLSGEGESWDERHRKLTETGTPDIEKLRKLRRQESQDRVNALHAATKIIVLKKAMADLSKENGTDLDWDSFYLRYFNPDGLPNVEGSSDYIHYPDLSAKENEIILRLAQLEHLRWNAAHELMGYVFNSHGTSCDERTMEHNCLCTWDKIDEQSAKVIGWPCDYKKYDFCVVDTTITLKKDALLPHESND